MFVPLKTVIVSKQQGKDDTICLWELSFVTLRADMGTLFSMSSHSYTLTFSLVDFVPTHVTENSETVCLHSYSKL